MTDSQDNDLPVVEATMTFEMPVPEGTSKEKALEAAEKEFSDIKESEEGDVEFEFIPPEE